jgi:non-heme chloroperoxidase
VIEALDLRNIAVFGFSTAVAGGTRYSRRHGTGRVQKIGLISAVPPLDAETGGNPDGTPIGGLRRAPLGQPADRRSSTATSRAGPSSASTGRAPRCRRA